MAERIGGGQYGGGLVISGGGSYSVASGSLLADAQALERVRDDVGRIAGELALIDASVSASALRRADAPLSALEAERQLDRAQAQLGEARARAATLAALLRVSAQGYGRAEHAAQQLTRQLAADLGYGIGFLAPYAIAMIAPALPAVLVALLAGALLVPGGPAAIPGALENWLKHNNRLLTNPLTVQLIRAGVMSIDDVIGGALGIRPEFVRMLGDGGLGVTGVDTSARLFATVGSAVGLLAESAVVARSTTTSRIARAPAGLAERIDRMPQRITDDDGEAHGSHIRIERYEMPAGADRYEVYITGTADFSPVSGAEAFDLTSDVTGVAGLPAGAMRAVRQAMDEAGITAESPVQFNGYSQGGLIAVSLAASGDYNTQGVFTAGAPTAQLEVPHGIAAVELEHTDDIVPALGGQRVDNTALVVEREAYAGRELPDGVAVPAHSRVLYRETAVLADRAASAQLQDAIGRLDGFASGSTSITSTDYIAARVPG